MRILVLAACPLPWPRGTPIRIHRMSEALSQRGHEVHVVTYPLVSPTSHSPYHLHRVGHERMRIESAPGPTFNKLARLDPLLIREARRLLAIGTFDVIHAHHYEGLIAALLARSAKHAVPIVYDAHTLLASELPHYRLPWPSMTSAWVGRWLDKQLPRRADHLIAVTDRMQAWFIGVAGVAGNRVSLIPNGVEHQHFAAAVTPQPEQNAGDHKYQPAHIVFTGNLAEYQGIDLLLQAFRRVRAHLPHARLSLVTDSPADHLSRRIADLGLTAHIARVSANYADLPALLATAHVLVNPRPQCEGIPQKLLNYMASGKPIVSFAGSAAVLEDERTALLVANDDVDAFAAAILRILEQPELGRRLGKAAQDKVAATHGWQQVAEKVETVYSRLLGQAR